MAGNNSADRKSPGGFFDRIAPQMPLSLHSAITLSFSPHPIQSQYIFADSSPCWAEMFLAFGHKSRREILTSKTPGSASTVNGGAANTKKPARSARLCHGQP
jgi:hypothetical protein